MEEVTRARRQPSRRDRGLRIANIQNGATGARGIADLWVLIHRIWTAETSRSGDSTRCRRIRTALVGTMVPVGRTFRSSACRVRVGPRQAGLSWTPSRSRRQLPRPSERVRVPAHGADLRVELVAPFDGGRPGRAAGHIGRDDAADPKEQAGQVADLVVGHALVSSWGPGPSVDAAHAPVDRPDGQHGPVRIDQTICMRRQAGEFGSTSFQPDEAPRPRRHPCPRWTPQAYDFGGGACAAVQTLGMSSIRPLRVDGRPEP